MDEVEVAADAARFEGRPPVEVLAWAAERFAGRVVFATGFGAEGCVLVDIVARHHLAIDVVTLDTGLLFDETYALWRRLEERYGIAITGRLPRQTVNEQAKTHGDRLWERDPDRCCALRKVEPLQSVLAGREAWISAIRRDQTRSRGSARWRAREKTECGLHARSVPGVLEIPNKLGALPMSKPIAAAEATLVAPHGGVLVDRFVPKSEAEALRQRALGLPSLVLDARELADLELIAVGAASPLVGYLGQADYVESRQVYGTEDPSHPGVGYLLARPRALVGGAVQVFPLPTDLPFAEHRFTPRALRQKIADRVDEHAQRFAGGAHPAIDLRRGGRNSKEGMLQIAVLEGASNDARP